MFVWFITDMRVSGTKFVEKGDAIHLECNATSHDVPPVVIDWFKNGIKLTPDGDREVRAGPCPPKGKMGYSPRPPAVKGPP